MLGFDRDVALDLVVNATPIGIVLALGVGGPFVLAFPPNPFAWVIFVGLLIVPVVCLAAVSLFAARVVGTSG